MIGVIAGEVAGHIINGRIQRIYMKRNAGAWTPEARLWVNYIACPFLIAGLIVFGFGLERHWHYMWVAVGWVSRTQLPSILGLIIDGIHAIGILPHWHNDGMCR
jgi:hypothetical protein